MIFLLAADNRLLVGSKNGGRGIVGNYMENPEVMLHFFRNHQKCCWKTTHYPASFRVKLCPFWFFLQVMSFCCQRLLFSHYFYLDGCRYSTQE